MKQRSFSNTFNNIIFISRIITIVIMICGVFTVGCNKLPDADLVLIGGKVVTVDENFSICEAVAVMGDRIIFVGTNKDANLLIGKNTKVIKLDGKLVLPGLIDAHAHLHSLGEELSYLNITGTRSFQEIIDKVAGKVMMVQPGEWIIGGRWDHNDWETKEFPVHDLLSEVSPDNPVYLRRIDGNSGFANKKALEIAGITKNTPDPAGGKIIRDKNLEPTGVLINRAMNLVKDCIPKKNLKQMTNNFLAAVNHCLANGLTGIHEAGVGPMEIALYKGLINSNQLPIRIYAMLGQQESTMLEGDLKSYFKSNRILQYGNHHLSVRSIKLFFDGALGSRGAAFFNPYNDDPGNTGLLRVSKDYIYRVAKAALEAGMGVNTHCIGIRGNRLCLQAYEKALQENPQKDHRFRIEHAQIVTPKDVVKFKELGVIPAMQPTHCTSDMSFVEKRVGKERAQGAYAWRWFLDKGLKIPCGSDFPVEKVNPLLGIYAAVTRQDIHGNPKNGWNSEQKMNIEEAIKGFTIWAAYAAFQEDFLGSIERGKLADFTILDTDILKEDPSKLLNAKVLYTLVGGKIKYSEK